MPIIRSQNFNYFLIITIVLILTVPSRLEAKTKETPLLKVSTKENVSRSKWSSGEKGQFLRRSAKNRGNRGKRARRKPQEEEVIMLGGLGAVQPEYEGAKDSEFGVLPYINAKYKNIFFIDFYDGLDSDGLGMNVLYAPDFRLGIALNYYEGRDDNIHSWMYVSSGFDVGVFGSISFGRLSAKLKIRQDISKNHESRLTSGRLSYRVPLSQRLRVNLNANATYASKDYIQYYYTLGGSAGIKDMGVGAHFMYLFSENWRFLTFLNYSRLVGDAANSYFVENIGSKNQFWLGLGVAWTW